MSLAYRQRPAAHAIIDLRHVPGFVPDSRCPPCCWLHSTSVLVCLAHRHPVRVSPVSAVRMLAVLESFWKFCFEGTPTLSWCRTHRLSPRQPFEAYVSRRRALLPHSRAFLSLRPKRATCSTRRKPGSCGGASAPRPAGQVIPRKQCTRRRQSTRYGSNAHMLS